VVNGEFRTIARRLQQVIVTEIRGNTQDVVNMSRAVREQQALSRRIADQMQDLARTCNSNDSKALEQNTKAAPSKSQGNADIPEKLRLPTVTLPAPDICRASQGLCGSRTQSHDLLLS